MKLIKIAVKRPLATIMLFLGVIMLGIISLRHLSIDLLPNLSFPKISVITEYLGASAEEMESLITNNLESSLSSIPGVKKVSSISREGVSLVTLEFHWGTEMNFALLHSKEKVEEARYLLPQDCEPPRIMEMDPGEKPIIIAVLGSSEKNRQSLAELREIAEILVKPRLEQLEGISKVDIQGNGEREALVVLNPERLALYQTGYDDVAEAVRNWNQEVLGGTVRRDKVRYLVKIEGEIKEISDLEKIPIRNNSQSPIMIKDLGEVRFSEKVRQGDIRFNHRSTVALLIYKESSGNTVGATREVEKSLKEMEKEFSDLSFHVVSEEAKLIVSAISSLKQAILQGGLLAFLVLLIFFQNFRDPILVVLISPISVLATFVLMYFSGITMNIMSLGGLALGIGLFMDNAIVVIENMNRLGKEQGPETAAILGTRELISALLGSTLTTLVIFLPVIYIYGISGRLFRDQSLTICYALTVAFFITITLLPSLFKLFSPGTRSEMVVNIQEPETESSKVLKMIHAMFTIPFRLLGFIIETLTGFSYILLKKIGKRVAFFLNRSLYMIYRIFNKSYESFAHWYHDFLLRCLEKKIIAVWITLVMFIGTLFLYLVLEKELLPQTLTDHFEIRINSTSLLGYEETEALGLKVERRISGLKGVDTIFSRFGTASRLSGGNDELSVNQIDLLVKCHHRSQRNRLMIQVRKILGTFSEIDRFSVFPERNTLSEYLHFGAEGFIIKVYFERLEDGKYIARKLKKELKQIPGTTDVEVNIEEGKLMLALHFSENLIHSLELSKKKISDQIINALRGSKVSTLRRFQRNYDILLTSPIRDNPEMEKILGMPILAGQVTLPLSQLVRFEPLSTIKEIKRDSQERFFTITANLQGVKSFQVARRLNQKLGKIALPSGVRVLIAGEEQERLVAFKSVGWALILSIILVYMVMAAEFENLVQPLIILLTIPMGLFGAFMALFLFGETINVISGIGMMLAVGVVVDDAIVKLECTNQMRAIGLSVRQSLLKASQLRLKPIILNSLTTVFGVFPMIYVSGVGAELQRPMAVVLAGSLLSSTFLTLILVPVLYEMVTKEKAK
jgi:HAE1 family hydrophobic/amphiphilic exporter-1